MSLAILSDEQVRAVLESLTYEEAETLIDKLRSALYVYSTGRQPGGGESEIVHQPERTVIHSKVTGATTLFMPSANAAGHAVKVVTVSGPDADPSRPTITPTGSVTLYSPVGTPVGFLHAKTLTAFRTALSSSCLLVRRASVQTLTVFGTGLQAYWHVRLALMLRGHTIKHVNIINRRFSNNAKDILKKFYAVAKATKEREGWESTHFNVLTPGYGDYPRLLMENLVAADVIFCCTPSTEDLFDAEILTNHQARRKGRLIVAIGSYTPKMRELPRELLLQATRAGSGGRHFHKHATEGGAVVVDTLDGALKEAGEIIEARLDPKQLVELGELVMLRKLREKERTHASSDDGESVSESLGKLDINSKSASGGPGRPGSSGSGSGSSGGISVRDFFHKRSSSRAAAGDDKYKTQQQRQDEEREDHLARWIRDGNVIYKSVGLGLMDLVVGMEVVRLAREKGVGGLVENFSS
ncbi:hypothetical protein DL766_000330 [Monosporascus sp. MC13-8B]|uniref:UbiD family decarboxylase n=1 Tax=Monosporascus cannonballus TaxID=155416 RepID=A0ABY0HFL1_9PEZI|nr:hypothetical protein DL762_001642 [Monosporascus cannonballus]RYP00010.1 hypothetical protein DL763_001140 [Monosporascus cannonballus]RYP39508.1 hypothetical protein DL766_000330 [Monosporascus sp. MC13-8B]